MDTFGEGRSGLGPGAAYPTVTQVNVPYDYYPGESTIRTPPVRLRRPWSLGVLTAGIGALLVGAWAGIVPFVGPTFGYHLGTTAAWRLTPDHYYLQLAPGAAGVLAGLVFLFFVPRRDRKPFWRGLVIVAALLAIAAGAWLVIGPDAYTVLRHVGPNGRSLPTTSLAGFVTEVGYYLGPGVLLAAFGGMALSAGPHRCRPTTPW